MKRVAAWHCTAEEHPSHGEPTLDSQVFAPSRHVITHPSCIPAPQRSAAPIQIRSIIHIVLNYSASDSPCALVPTADLQRAIKHARGAGCHGDLDGHGSHPHQPHAAGNAARLLQVPAAEHQASRRCGAPHHVGSSRRGFQLRPCSRSHLSML